MENKVPFRGWISKEEGEGREAFSGIKSSSCFTCFSTEQTDRQTNQLGGGGGGTLENLNGFKCSKVSSKPCPALACIGLALTLTLTLLCTAGMACLTVEEEEEEDEQGCSLAPRRRVV